MLRFEREPAAVMHRAAALHLPLVLDEVACVELKAGLVGPDFHRALVAAEFGDLPESLAIEAPVVVVAGTILEDGIGVVDALAHLVECAEVEGRPLYARRLADRREVGIDDEILVGVDHEFLVENRPLAVHVEVDVLGHVERGCLVGRGAILDAPDVFGGDRINDLGVDLAGEAAFAVREGLREHGAHVVAILELLVVPDVRIPAALAAVEVGMVVGVILIEDVIDAVERELAVGDAVADAADDRAEVGVGLLPAGNVVEPDRHILEFAGGVGDEQANDLAARVGDLHHEAAFAAKREQAGLLAVFRRAEVRRWNATTARHGERECD